MAMPAISTAETMLQDAESGDGAGMWHKFCNEYSPKLPDNVVTELGRLVEYKFSGQSSQLSRDVRTLDLELTKYMRKSGELLSDTFKRGVLLKALSADAQLQKHIFRNSTRLNTFDLMRDEILFAAEAKKSLEPVLMEIGKVGISEIECWKCGEKGHVARECRKRA
jgi:hypothetical protein